MSSKGNKLTRRAFIISGSIIGGGLLVGVGGLTYANKKMLGFSGEGLGEGNSLNAWVRIDKNNKVKLAIPRAEMGQGIHTALPMLIAEELDIDLNQCEIIHPQLEPPYANVSLATDGAKSAFSSGFHFMQKVAHLVPYVATGGSTTIRDAYFHFRRIGATTRELLVKAAAKKWSSNPSDLRTEAGYVINPKDNNKLSYGDLAEEAAKEKPSENPTLKSKSEFKLLGKPIARLDIQGKVNGKAEFGLDVRRPDMLFAVIKHAPVCGSKVLGIKNEDQVLAMPGIRQIVKMDDAIAVVGDNTWRAKNASLAAQLDIETNGNESLDDAGIKKMLNDAMKEDPTVVFEDEGNVNDSLVKSTKTIKAEYEVPYLAHACMEPLNCTILVENDTAEVWVGHQAPTLLVWGVAKGAEVGNAGVKINITYLGGGFGRRVENDFAIQAGIVGRAMEGTPIQLVWTREEDMQHDPYRPLVLSRFEAGFDENNELIAWKNKIANQSVMISMMQRNAAFMTPSPSDDTSSTEGATELPYKIGSRMVDVSLIDLPIQVGTWRSVGHSQNAFFTESFVDEAAHAVNEDPYLFRKKLIEPDSRQAIVLDRVAQISGWKKPLGPGKSRGIALHKSFGSIVGQVVEISMTEEKEVIIDKVYCVIDCGVTVNPDTIEAQMQGGIVFGLSAGLYGKINFSKGKVKQSNFPNYEMVRMKVMPEVIVDIIDNNEDPGGVGEPGTPPIAPALTNAIFAGNGERIRSLPLTEHGYKFI